MSPFTLVWNTPWVTLVTVNVKLPLSGSFTLMMLPFCGITTTKMGNSSTEPNEKTGNRRGSVARKIRKTVCVGNVQIGPIQHHRVARGDDQCRSDCGASLTLVKLTVPARMLLR